MSRKNLPRTEVRHFWAPRWGTFSDRHTKVSNRFQRNLKWSAVVRKLLVDTIAWGLEAATFLTLFVIHCLYAIVDDIGRKLHVGRFNGYKKEIEGMVEEV